MQKERKRFFLFNKYYCKLKLLKNQLNKIIINKSNTKEYYSELLKVNFKIQKLPRNSNGTRIRNRCYITGRPRGVLRLFGLSRSIIRDIAFKGYIPGILKSSW
ncbi:30S ribosomal subunit protein S14 [Candidatus Nasuia deltocephalinicola str. NAS-ALF]|uniref:Small ribosomal subunit protein uS14 n=1 Tax=Candidatus Nasuia deltocephalinicola str. NAS-ALF TaxID=1343077 RepID=S5SQC0_9PROT|nr:30S ribosomal subunit protein S14 [Candidatus Nasuia deltocephalinicola str. NAS-ALF]